ncbi:hypothetical protein KUTeg_020135 [Tegillarca granosa]|uniref:Nephrocystin 3-like N-terminal domain-containing protein n=1 Tax=Tegillarca granosa TaxID=220873 RepID=A0ABQ9E6X1_TEGGR|nr:hypothetical protein KUTeg_020135 [Tegillarca granosa]
MVQQGFFLDDDEEMAPQEPANQKYSLRKQIVPYICSTQEDFKEERDFLLKNIFPQIDQICRNRGASFSPVDIRWSDTDDSVSNGHLLKLNLDYICKCSPFFICLLGETYGPYRPVDSPPFPRRIPKSPEEIDEVESWIDRNYFIAASAGYNWILKEAHQNNSIPELEIIQAAFFNDNKHCHFYFRQPEHLDHKYGHLSKDERDCLSVVHKPDSEYADLNIRDLKQRIVKKGLPVKYFKTFEELGNHVLKDWTAIIETLYPPLTFDSKILGSEEYQEWIANETFADFRRQLFIKSPEYNSLMNEITDFANSISEDAFLEEEEQLSIYRSYSVTSSLRKKKQADAKYKSMLLLQGDRGCGKSTLIANWLHRFMIDFPNVKVIYQYIGSSAKSRDIAIFMRRCIEELRTEYLRPDSEIDGPTLLDDNVPWTFHDVAQAFVAALSLGPCVLVMDGLDEIASSLGITSREIKNFSWLPFPLPSQCRLICTTCRSDLSYFSLSKRTDVRSQTIPLFDSLKIRLNFLEDYMQQYYDHLKHLPGYEKQITDIKLTTRPLFLSTLATEMQTFEIYTNLEKYLDDTYDHCSSFRDLCVRCFNRWTREHSWQKECLFLDSTDEEPELEFEGWVPDVLRLLAVARTGLTQTDLFGLLEQLGYTGRKVLTSFKWLQFKSCIGNLIYEKPDGLIQFSHHHIRETVEYILLHTLKPGATDVMTRTDPEKAWKEQKKKYHCAMAKYFMQQPFSQRIMEELPWQLMMAGDVDSLVKVLTDPIVIEKMLDNKKLNPSNKLELAYYWSLLKNLDVSAAAEYQKLLMKIGVINTMYPDEKPTHSEELPTDRDSVMDDLPLSVITGTDGKCTPPLFTPVSIPTINSPPPTDREQLSVIEESMSTTDSDTDYKAEIKREMDRKFESTPKTSSVKGEVIDTIFLTEAKAKHDAIETEHDDKDGTKGGNLSYITKLTWLISDLLKDLGYIYVTERILLALNSKLDKSYPLPLETQLIHAKIQERLGMYETDKQRSERWYRKSLRTVMNISDLEEDDPFYMDLQNIKGLDCSQECGNLPLRATILFNIGLLRAKQEDFLLSETNLRQALNMRELWYGKSHPLVSEVLFVLAGIMGNPRNRKGTVKIQEECRGKDDITVANTLFELGKLLQDEISFQAKCEAVRLLRRALDIKTSKLVLNIISYNIIYHIIYYSIYYIILYRIL